MVRGLYCSDRGGCVVYLLIGSHLFRLLFCRRAAQAILQCWDVLAHRVLPDVEHRDHVHTRYRSDRANYSKDLKQRPSQRRRSDVK